MALFVGTIVGVLIGIPVFVLIYLVAICAVIWDGWWMYPAWGWFVVPLGLPAISLWQFIGLMALLKARPAKAEDSPKWSVGQWAGHLVGLMLAPVCFWVFLRWLHQR